MLNAFRRTGKGSRAAMALAVVAALIAIQVPVIPAPEAPVNIRWAAAVTDPQRVAAARELGLELVQIRDDGVWIARITNPSTAVIRAIIQDPRVADTHHIDRGDFTLAAERITIATWLTAHGPLHESVDDLIRPAVVPLAGLLLLVWVSLRPAFRGQRAWLARGIPDLSAHALAAFRIAYGTMMMLVVSDEHLGPLPREAHRVYDFVARNDIVRDISASAAGAASIQTALLCSLGLFTVGLAPRATLALSATLLTLFTAVMVTHTSIHDWALPMVTMWLLVVAPWNEGFGLSWMWRRWRGGPEPASSNPRGLAVWLPALAVGVAFAAAAFAKLDASGIEWITGGAVRYHFVEDSASARVAWGLRIAASDAASVLLSLAAVTTEALFIAVLFFRQWTIRLLFGVAAAAILMGFYLFQGVWWPAWWVLLLALLPWSPAVDALVSRLPRLTVLADGECPLCRRTARVLHALDWFDRLTFADASDDAVRTRVAPGVGRETALTEMHVIDAAGTQAAGYDGYLRIAVAVPLLWIPGLIGKLPPIAAAGRRVYGRVAASRVRRGRCTDEVCAPGQAPLPVRQAERRRTLTRAAVLVVGGFMSQQIIVSALRLESEPLVSNFPMYSSTWPSGEAFNEYWRENPRQYQLSTDTLGVNELERRLKQIPEGRDALVVAIERAVEGKEWAPDERGRVLAVQREYEARFGEPLDTVAVALQEHVFNWGRGAFDTTVIPAGTLDITSGTLRGSRIARSRD